MLKPSAITLLFIIVAMTLELAVSVNFDELTRFETQPTYLSFIRQEIPETPIVGDHITADYELAVHSTMVNQSNENEYFSLAIFGASFMKGSKADRTFIYKVSKYRFTDNSTNANATTTGNQNGKFMTDYLRMIKKDQETTLDSPDPDPITIEPRSFEGKNAQLIIETTKNLMSWRFRISFGPENAYVFWWTIDYGKRGIGHFDVYRNSAEIISEDPLYNVLAGKLKHSLTKITKSSELSLNHLKKLNHSSRVQLRAFESTYDSAFMLNLRGIVFTKSNFTKEGKKKHDEYKVQNYYTFSAIAGSKVHPTFKPLIDSGVHSISEEDNATLQISQYSNSVTNQQVTTNFKFILTMETERNGTWELKWEMAFSDYAGTLVYLQVTKPRQVQRQAETQAYSTSPKNAMLIDYTSSD